MNHAVVPARARRLGVAAVLALACVLFARAAGAHVGSPDTWFEGSAGAYRVRVVVRAPAVVPGLAEITVRVLDGAPSQVSVQPRAWNAGVGGVPPADVAQVVSGDPHLYTVSLWFMAPTSYAVLVSLSGDRGQGTVVVPVQVVATKRLPMERSLVWTLVGLGLFLFFGLLTAVGAAVGESAVPPGQVPDARRRVRARIAVALAAVVLIFGVVGGRGWWDGLDREFHRDLYRPPHATASIETRGDEQTLELAIDDPSWASGRGWTPLIPDHGKIMHLFLIADPSLGAIAHLHPVLRDSSHFAARVPALPPGRYRVYADIVHESGFAQTLTASVELPPSGAHANADAGTAIAATAPAAAPATARAAGAAPASDADDSWFAGEATSQPAAAEAFALPDGSVLTWERGAEPIVAGRDHPLRFTVRTADGAPAPLEPYMGMAAHAVVTRTDGAVFAHLHPTGTVSMASEMALTERAASDSLPGMLGRRLTAMGDMPMMSPALHAALGAFEIPYGFPSAGRYRLWVQVKLHGRILTAAFDTDVVPAPSAKAGT